MEELFKLVAAGGDLGTVAIVYVLMKHNGMLTSMTGAMSDLKAKISYIEKFLLSGRVGQ